MELALGHVVTMLIPIVAIIAVFTFIAVASWSDNRRKEREAYYRHETYRKLIDGEQGSDQVRELMREEDRQRHRRRIEGLKLGGLVTGAVGLALMVFLRQIVPDEQVFLVGGIPLLIGVVLLAYVYLLAGKPE